MTHVNGFICRQGQLLLENNRYAVFCALFLALFPYTTWLSLAIIALVTLRKGWRDGAMLLMPVLTAYLTCALVSFSVCSSIINTLLTFLPCYLAACLLGLMVSWRSVANAFFVLLILISASLHVFVPEFITNQYLYLYKVIHEAQPELLSKYLNDVNGYNQTILANYFFGLQWVSLFISVIMPLLMARFVQSRLFYPSGFRHEILTFRGNRMGLFMLVMMLFAVSQGKVIAMNALPILVFYFLLAGLSLSAHLLVRKKIRGGIVILAMPLLLMPFVMLPVYVILGSLDSLFNLRFYLPLNVGETT